VCCHDRPRYPTGVPPNRIDVTEPVRVRFAPSPTGSLHVGGARTALFNWLLARHTEGVFVLRLEDTDRERSTPESEAEILRALAWLGLDWDEGPFRQSERDDVYRSAVDRLRASGAVYPAWETEEELDAQRAAARADKRAPVVRGRRDWSAEDVARFEAEGRRPVWRFAVELPGETVIEDLIRGPVRFDHAHVEDFVVARSDGTPTYNLAAAVDDVEMAISHVLRGEDHISNTPKQLLIFRALGYPEPRFAHLPLILNPDRTKMSKRKSQTAVDDYRGQGFIREGLVNYLAYLGWSPGTEEDVLSVDEIVRRFDIHAVQKGGARFDRDRLEWLNGQWIRRLEPDDLVDRLRPFLQAAVDDGRIARLPSDEEVRALLPIVQERLPTLGAVVDLVGFLWTDDIRPDPAILVPKRWDAATTRDGLAAARDVLAAHDGVTWEADELEPPLRALVEERGWKAGDLFMAIRVATTGRTATPPLFDTLVALGRERTLARLDGAVESLGAPAA
jgi:glutamyl-tRNA synthetase